MWWPLGTLLMLVAAAGLAVARSNASRVLVYNETGAPIAGEMSGHMFFSEGYFGFDDALFAAGRLLRYVAASGRTLDELVASIPQYCSTPETRLTGSCMRLTMKSEISTLS